MVKKLILNNYGMFNNFSLEFKNLNIIIGKNESGKTTIFDALLTNLTTYNQNNSIFNKIKNRYDKRESQIEGSIKKIGIEEFFHFNCLKSGEINLDFNDQKAFNNLRKNLLNGGYDIHSIIKELDKPLNARGENSIKKSSEKLNESIIELKNKMNRLIQDKNNILNEKNSIESINQRIKDIDEKLIELNKEKEKKEKQIKDLKNYLEYEKLKKIYSKLLKLSEDNKNIQANHKFNSDNLIKLEELNKLHEENTKSYEIQYRLNLEKKIQFDNLKTKYDNDKIKFDSESNQEAQARNLKNNTEECLQNPKKITITKIKNLPLWIASILISIFGLGVIGLGLYKEEFSYLTFGILLFTLSLFGLFFSIQKKEELDTNWVNQKLQSFLRNASFLDNISNTKSLEELNGEITSYLQKRAFFSSRLKDLLNEINNLSEELNSLNEKLQELDKQKKQSEYNLNTFLSNFNIQSLMDFKNLKIKQDNLKEQVKHLENEVTQDLKTLGIQFNSIDECIKDLQTKIHLLENINILTSGTDSDLKKFELELSTLNESINSLKSEKNELVLKSNTHQTSFTHRLEQISKDLNFTQDELFQNQTKLKELEKRQSALNITKKIFEEIKNESEDIFLSIQGEITKFLKELFPSPRKVEIIDPKNISMEDQYGNVRQLENLSLGTRDAFYLAAKLALAEKNNKDIKIFLMDEPFASFDSERSKLFMDIIKQYIKMDWQFFIFSKDTSLKDKIPQDIIEKTKIIYLGQN